MPISQEQQEQINKNNETYDPDKMVLDDHVKEEASDATPQESPDELRAREEGWVPLDEWGGEKDQWVDHKEFLFRGELMGRIKKQTKHINGLKGELDDMRAALKELGEHNKKIAENERKKALQELRAAKKEAFEDQDFEALEEIDERMSALKSVELDEPKVPEPKETDTGETAPVIPEVETWLGENEWYTKNTMLQGMTNGAVQQLLNDDPDLESEPAKLLNKAKQMVQETVPHMFDEDEAPKPKPKGPVEPSNRNGNAAPKGGKVKYKASMLSDEQKRIGQTFVRSGAIESLDVYAAQLAELGELSQ